MTDATTPANSTTPDAGSDGDVPRFPSLDAMRSVHGGMLKRKKEAAGSPEFHEQALAFIRSAQATGALLDSDCDRQTAQSLIDYWVTALFRATREEQGETALVEFDPELASHELHEDQYPYADRTFDEQGGAALLLGTHRLVHRCIERIEQTRLVTVVGPIGSGRGTLLRSGLLPALKEGDALGSAHWRFFPVIEPGSKPLLRLAELFRSTEDDERWVSQQVDRFRRDATHLTYLLGRQGDEPAILVVDRFEEIFTSSDNVDRDAFVENLVTAVQAPSSTTICSVVLLMKADYLARADALPLLKPYFQNSLVYVSFTADEIREAIEKPAGQIGLKFAEGLVDRLILDVQGDPAALALLQFTLRKLWDQRQMNRIMWDAYNRVGGGRLALERSAESVYRELTPDEQSVAKKVFLQLVRPGLSRDAETPPVARQTLYAGAESQANVDHVLDHFIQARLLNSLPGESAEDQQVAMANAALVGHWPRLVEWLSEERDRIRRRLRLSDATNAWRDRDKDPAVLWRGSLLDEAERYSDLNEGEKEFVQASRKAVVEAERAEIETARREAKQAKMLASEQQQRAEAESRGRKRTQRLACALAGALTVAMFLAGLTYHYYRNAEVARRDAHRQSVMLTVTHGTQLVQNGDRPGAALWFADAMKDKAPELFSADSGDVLARRVTANLRQQPLLKQLWYQSPPKDLPDSEHFLTDTATFSQQTNQVLVTNSDKNETLGDARLFDLSAEDRKPLCFAHRVGPVRCAAISPNGKWLVTAGKIKAKPHKANTDGDTHVGNSEKGLVRLWNANDAGQHVWQSTSLTGGVNHVAFSSDSRYLAVASGKLGSGEGELCVFEIGNGTPQQPLIRWDQGGAVRWVAFANQAPDVSTAPVADKFWLSAACEQGTESEFSARIWQLPAASQNPVAEIPHNKRVNRVAFSADGNWVVSAAGSQFDEHGELQIWNYAKKNTKDDNELAWQLHVKRVYQGGVTAAEFSPCGRLVVTASHSGSAVMWDLRGREGLEWKASFRHKSSVYDARFSPDGRFVATSSRDGTARIWEAATGKASVPPMYHEGTVGQVRFSPDSQYLLTVSRHTVRVWELATGNKQPHLLKPTGEVARMAINADGTHLVTVGQPRGYEPATCQIWALADKATNAAVELTLQVKCAAIGAKGQFLVTADSNGTVTWWQIKDNQARRVKQLARNLGTVNHLTISQDGRLVAAGTGDLEGSEGSAYVWDVNTDETRLRLNKRHNRSVLAVAFDASGKRLVTARADDSARVWDIETGSPIGRLLQHTADVSFASFSRDDSSRYVVTASFDRTAVVWDTATGHKLATMRHEGYVTDARFSPKEKYLVTTSSDGIAYVWYLDSREDSGSSARALFPEIVMVMEPADLLQQASFDESGNHVTTVGYYSPSLMSDLSATPVLAKRLIRAHTWRLSPDVDDAISADAFASLQGARFLAIKRQDIEVLDATQLGELWKIQGDKYRDMFSEKTRPDRLQRLARECEDTSQWYSARCYLDKLIEAELTKADSDQAGLADLRFRRAHTCAELQEWKAAACEAEMALEQGNVEVYSLWALSRLAAGKDAGYAEACSEMLTRFSEGEDQRATNTMIWTLVQAPNKEFNTNSAKILDLAEKLVANAREPQQDPYALPFHRCLNALGAAYYRAGEYQKAIDKLLESEKSYEIDQQQRGLGSAADFQEGKIWNWLFLAMAHARLGQQKAAESYLQTTELVYLQGGRRDPQRLADALGTPSPTWKHFFSLQKLYDEMAETVSPETQKTGGDG